jgi:hypothetical protein
MINNTSSNEAHYNFQTMAPELQVENKELGCDYEGHIFKIQKFKKVLLGKLVLDYLLKLFIK